MFVNLTDVFTNEGRTVTMQVDTDLVEVIIGRETFPIKDKTPINLTFTNIGKGKVRITGDAKITLGMNCDRCLKPVDETIELAIDREVYAPDRIADVPDEIVDQDFIDGCQMDLDDFLNIEIVINLPTKVLCKPDCRGICRQCGTDLNTGICDCDTFIPDPRMALIKDIFNGNKEV